MSDNSTPQPWALELNAELSDQDRKIIAHGGSRGTTDCKKAALILQKIVIDNSKHLSSPQKSKPGPKKKRTINLTDEDIAAIYTVLKMILKMPHGTKNPEVHKRINNIICNAGVYLEKHLLLTRSEANSLWYHLSKIFNQQNHPYVISNFTIGEMCDIETSDIINTWSKAEKVNQGAIPVADKSGDTRSKKSPILQLAEHLKLWEIRQQESPNKGPEAVNADTKSDSGGNDPTHDTGNSPMKRKKILWAAMGFLVHLINLINDARVSWKPNDPEMICDHIIWLTAPKKPGSKKSTHSVNENAAIVHSIILRATLRQGNNPFAQYSSRFITATQTIEPGLGFKSPVTLWNTEDM